MDTTDRQRTALRHPYGRARQILDPRYWATEKAGISRQSLFRIRSALTVNR